MTPRVVHQNYLRMTEARRAKEEAVSPRRADKDTIIRLHEENDLLRKKNGGGFMPSATVDELGELIRESLAISYRRRLVAKLEADIVADERQDAIEAKVKKPARKVKAAVAKEGAAP